MIDPTEEKIVGSREVDMEPGIDQRSLFQRGADWLFGYDFFISYCWEDGRKYAISLNRKLESYGFNCFLDSSDYAKGDNWRDQGRRALKRTSRLVLVGTQMALQSEPVENELRIYSGLGRRIIPIDLGGVLDANGSSEGVFAYLDPEALRILESRDALTDGPSAHVCDQIRDSFDLIRQDQKRVRLLTCILIVVTALAVIAIALGLVAESQRKLAVASRDAATESAARSYVRTIGSSQRTQLSPQELEALWELAETTLEGEPIRLSVIRKWFKSIDSYSKVWPQEGCGLKAAVGISPERNEAARPFAKKLAGLFVASMEESKEFYEVMSLAGGLMSLCERYPDEAANEGAIIIATRFRMPFGPDELSDMARFLGDSVKQIPEIDAPAVSRLLVGNMRDSAGGYQVVFSGEALGHFDERLPEVEAAEGARLLVVAMRKTKDPDLLRDLGWALANLSKRLPEPEAFEGAQMILRTLKKTEDERSAKYIRKILERLLKRIPHDSGAEMVGLLVDAMDASESSIQLEFLVGSIEDLSMILTESEVSELASDFAARIAEPSANSNRRDALVQGMVALGEYLPAEVVAEIARFFVTGMKNTNDIYKRSSLGVALAHIGERVPAIEAGEGANHLAAAMNEAGISVLLELNAAVEALGFLGERLPATEAAEISELLMKGIRASSRPAQFVSFGAALASLGENLTTADAVEVARLLSISMRSGTEPWQSRIGQTLVTVFDRLPASEKTEALGRLRTSIRELTDPSTQNFMSNVVVDLGWTAPSEDGAEIADSYVTQLRAVEDSQIRKSLIKLLMNLGEKLPNVEAAEAARVLVRQMRDFGDRTAHSALKSVGEDIGVLGEKLQLTDLRRYAIYYVLLGSVSGVMEGAPPTYRSQLTSLCNSSTKQELAEMLKWPFCVDEAEKIVLAELEERTGAKFSGSLTQFIRQAESLGIKNLNGPAVRPTTDQVLESLDAIIGESPDI